MYELGKIHIAIGNHGSDRFHIHQVLRLKESLGLIFARKLSSLNQSRHRPSWARSHQRSRCTSGTWSLRRRRRS